MWNEKGMVPIGPRRRALMPRSTSDRFWCGSDTIHGVQLVVNSTEVRTTLADIEFD